ncbi:MAG: hypothetical protein ACOYK8_04815 [Alphaproteobacteria bacterium]
MLPFDWQGDSDKERHVLWFFNILIELNKTNKGKLSIEYLKTHDVPVLISENGPHASIWNSDDNKLFLNLNPNRVTANCNLDNPLEPLIVLHYAETLPHELEGHHRNKDNLHLNPYRLDKEGFVEKVIEAEAKADFHKMMFILERFETNLSYIVNPMLEPFRKLVQEAREERQLILENPTKEPKEYAQASLEIEHLETKKMPEFQEILWPGYWKNFNNPEINAFLNQWQEFYPQVHDRVMAAAHSESVVIDHSKDGKIYSGRELVQAFEAGSFEARLRNIPHIRQGVFSPDAKKIEGFAAQAAPHYSAPRARAVAP